MKNSKVYKTSLAKMAVCLWLCSLLGLIDLYAPSIVVVLRIVLISIAFIFFAQVKKYSLSKYGFMYTAFFIWSFIIVLRGTVTGNPPLNADGSGFIISIVELFKHSYSPYSLFSYLLPLVMLVDFKNNNLASVIPFLLKLSFLSCFVILFALYLFREPLFFSPIVYGFTQYVFKGEELMVRYFINIIFTGITGILLFTYSYKYLRNKYKVLPLLLFVYFFINAWGGGRGDTLLSVGYLLTFFVLMYTYKGDKKAVRIFDKATVILVFVLGVSLVVYLFNQTDIFDFFMSRLFVGGELGGELEASSRETFTNYMINDFNQQGWPWLFGKGINGYYMIMNSRMREWMEWGYLWLILKGGIIYLLLYVGVLSRSFYLGVFKSTNLFSKACGCICLWQVLSLIPFGIPTVSFNMFVVWMCCGMMLHPEIRYCNETEIKKYFVIK